MLTKQRKFLYLYALVLFVLSAIYGLLLRWNFTFPLKFIDYHNFLQSHSHVTFLGWGYIATIGVIIKNFVHDSAKGNKTYIITIPIIVLSITLMLISFPLGGYKMFSIVLLSVFGVTSYVLSFRLLKDLKGDGIPVKLIKYGIYYYLLSSLATWFLAWVLLSQGKTNLYYNTVYFYLHFLYNGYFAFVLFGLIFYVFDKQQISISKKYQQNFVIYLNIACIPAYALSILWSDVSIAFNVIGFAASMLQLISLLYLIKIMQQAYSQLKWSWLSRLLLTFSLVAYSLKICIQISSAFPLIVKKSMALKPFFIIGYLHLFTLAFMSVLLFLLLNKLNVFSFSKQISKIGLVVFLVGVLVTELLLFLQGTLLLIGLKPIENYNLSLLTFSFFIVVGLLLIFTGQLFQKAIKEK